MTQAHRHDLSMVGRCLAAMAAIWLSASAPAAAQTSYPNRTIKIVAPFPAGAPADSIARLVADRLEKAWRQPVVVENRAGGGGILGAAVVAKAEPDGYTMLFTSSSPLASAPALTRAMPYDSVKDFAPIWAVNSSGLVVVVNPALPIRSLGEFMEHARTHPGQLSFASSGHGTTQHLAGELLIARTGVKLVHVPYRGGFAGMTDLMAGHVQVMFDSLGNTLQNIRAGKLRALAVLRPKRSAQLPDLPTAAEGGIAGVDMVGWLGLFAPVGTSQPILDKVIATLGPAMKDPEIVQKLIELGNENDFLIGPELGQRLAEDRKLFAEIVEKAGIEPQ
jgi:tripartite-type tricarboxylate transporter receptor subunit TctC